MAIKILIVMHGSGLGGVEKSLQTLCKYIDREKFQLTVALPSEGPMKSYLDDLGITTFVTQIDAWTPIPFIFGERHYYQFLTGMKDRVRGLKDIIRKNDIDIVHSSTLSVADGAFAARLAGKPHIWHIHGKSVGTTNAYGSYLPVETIYSLVADLSACIVAVSNDVSRFLQGYIPGESVKVVYNGIDINEFDAFVPLSTTFRNEFHLHDKRLVVLVGRVTDVKGINDYVEAAIKVLSEKNDVAFLVVGREEDKDLSEKIKKRINSANFSKGIIFTGERTDIPAILKEADIVVCSSKAEGFPYSILEAMSAAKPVVTTRCGGPEEMVIHKETGFHVDVGSPEQIAECVIALLDNRQLMESMRQKSRMLAEQRFSAEVYARNFEGIYTDIYNSMPQRNTDPWEEAALDMVSNIGDFGTRIRRLEHEIRDLRNFEALFKNNFIYRGIKGLKNFLNK
ncbi:MAG: glycosyltransferase family 4 protein [Nitrospirae bacterium]|nr:glycosyltransferase family 4 protein [Nitrospirota bacterium]